MTENKGILNRYARVLDVLATVPNGMTLTEIMHATRLPRGTIHRLIGALCEVGYIESSNGRKIYVLGARLLGMLHLGTADEEIARVVQPILDALVECYGETAFLAKLSGFEVRSVAIAVPSGDDQSYVRPGRIMPIHATASAKAICAYQNKTLIDDMLSRPLEAFTDKTLVGDKQIRDEFSSVRSLGFAICDDELDPGVFSYACPVDVNGIGVIYSVGLVGLTERLKRRPGDGVITDLRDAADKITKLLSDL